jgi:methionyl-tRNA formyltransferase
MTVMQQTIVFFGSGPVAAESLALLAKNFAVEAVVTKPKPEHHRGAFPVIDTAEALGLPIHTVAKRTELSELIATNPFSSKVGVLIDFGIIVGQDVIDYFPFGIVNSHFSVLPEWRGADPISFAILSGQPKTGVSLMLIDQGMDTGKILATKSIPIEQTDTTPTLTDKLIVLSDEMLLHFLPLYVNGEVVPRQQSHPDRATYSRKLTKEDGIIDWSKPAAVIEREIRAFIDWPKSVTQLAGKDIVITKAHVMDDSGVIGAVEIRGKELIVYCGENALVIDRLKPAGKNEMTSEAFLAGHKHLL